MLDTETSNPRILSTTEAIDDFIKRTQSLDLVYDEKRAAATFYTFEDKSRKNFVDCLSIAIGEYQTRKLVNSPELADYAQYAYVWINRAFMHGLLKEGPGLLRKLDDSNREKEYLRKELDNASRKIAELEEEKGFRGNIGGMVGGVERG